MTAVFEDSLVWKKGKENSWECGNNFEFTFYYEEVTLLSVFVFTRQALMWRIWRISCWSSVMNWNRLRSNWMRLRTWEETCRTGQKRLSTVFLLKQIILNNTNTFIFICLSLLCFMHMWPWSTKPVLSLGDIFVAIAKNTLYGSKL